MSVEIVETYPKTFKDIPEQKIVETQNFLARLSAAELEEWTKAHTVTHMLGDQAYRMVMALGDNPSRVIVAAGEFGNGLDAIGAVARLRVIQKIVDEDATIILQPNSALGQDNMNFSKVEREALKKGSSDPIIHRIMTTLEHAGSPEDIIGYGPSQGGTTVLALGAHPDMPGISSAIVETPNIEERSVLQLGNSFRKAGADLKKNIESNFTPESVLREELIASLSVRGLLKYGLGLGKTDNRSLLGSMLRSTAEAQMCAILEKDGTVVHAWAEGDTVSRAVRNQEIADRLRSKKGYQAFEYSGDHSITNLYLLNAALTFQADKTARS